MTVLGVDFSQHGGALSPETVECWKAEGVRFAIVQYSHRMRQHLDTLIAAGDLTVEAYVYLYWGMDPWGQTAVTRTENTLGVLRDYPAVRRLWLDCEDTTHRFVEAELRECVQAVQQAGLEPAIYTGRWWWELQTIYSTAFADLPLWHAEYLSAAPDFAAFRPYGGWTAPLIWQYQGTTTLCGHSVDLNVMEEAPSGALSMDEREELDNLRITKTLAEQGRRLRLALDLGRLVVVPGPTPETVEIYEVVSARGRPFVPPVVLPAE